MKRIVRSWGAIPTLLPVMGSLAVLLLGRPNGPLIVIESGTILNSPSLCSSCHVGILTGGRVEIQGAPDTYTPGISYPMTLEIEGIEFLTRVYGFQLIAFYQESGLSAGELVPQTQGTEIVQVPGEVSVLTHSDPLETGHVAFLWTAPETAAGPVVLRVASNSADGNFSPSNDLINTDEVILQPGVQLPPSGSVFYFPQIGAGEFQDIRFSTELVLLNVGNAAPLLIEFSDSMGNHLELVITIGQEPATFAHAIERVLQSGETLTITLQGSEGLQVGYARVATGSQIGGIAIFSQFDRTSGVIEYQAGVAATGTLREFSMPVKFTPGSIGTGLALARPPLDAPAGEENPIVFRLYDSGFSLLATTSIVLAPGEHIARFISEFFPEFLQELTSPFQGSLTVESPYDLAPLTLLQTSAPTLTAFPVIVGRSDAQP